MSEDTTPGLFARLLLAWVAYFRPGFHPWTIDDRALIADYEAGAGTTFVSDKKVRRAA